MNGSSDAGSIGVSDKFVKLEVVFDVVFVVYVMFFSRPSNFWFGGNFRKLPSRFQNRFEILAGERCYVVRLRADNLFDEVFKQARELIRHFNLLSRENSLIVHVRHY